jgi:urea transport system substrate-binding protein
VELLPVVESEANEFIETWQAFTKNDKRVTNDPMEAACRRLQHVGEGGREGQVTTDTDKVLDALPASRPRT